MPRLQTLNSHLPTTTSHDHKDTVCGDHIHHQAPAHSSQTAPAGGNVRGTRATRAQVREQFVAQRSTVRYSVRYCPSLHRFRCLSRAPGRFPCGRGQCRRPTCRPHHLTAQHWTSHRPRGAAATQERTHKQSLSPWLRLLVQ